MEEYRPEQHCQPAFCLIGYSYHCQESSCFYAVCIIRSLFCCASCVQCALPGRHEDMLKLLVVTILTSTETLHHLGLRQVMSSLPSPPTPSVSSGHAIAMHGAWPLLIFTGHRSQESLQMTHGSWRLWPGKLLADSPGHQRRPGLILGLQKLSGQGLMWPLMWNCTTNAL